jgi:hypothetical protein
VCRVKENQISFFFVINDIAFIVNFDASMTSSHAFDHPDNIVAMWNCFSFQNLEKEKSRKKVRRWDIKMRSNVDDPRDDEFWGDFWSEVCFLENEKKFNGFNKFKN